MEDFGSLKVFRELTLTGSPEKFKILGDAIERLLPAHWTRSRQKENNNLSYFGADDEPLLVFERSAVAQLPAAGLVMLGVGGTMKVINIVPLKTHQLSTNHYNAILAEFADVAVRPAAESLDLAFQISTDIAPITTWLSERATKALQRFSCHANHASGSSHPRDRERWFAFLDLCHRDGCSLDTDTLQRYLVEIDGWPPEQASDLAIEYEFARNLLSFVAYEARQ